MNIVDMKLLCFSDWGGEQGMVCTPLTGARRDSKCLTCSCHETCTLARRL